MRLQVFTCDARRSDYDFGRQNSIQKFTIKLRHYGIKVRNPANQNDELRPPHSMLAAIPRFIRFDKVGVCYYSKIGEPTKLTEEICDLLRPFLQLLRGHKAAIKNSSFSLEASIQCARQFRIPFPSHQKVLEYLANELLPTFDSCRRYKFDLLFRKDADHAKEVIASLLGLPAVERCSNVEILFKFAEDELPAEAILHWLNFNHPNDGEGRGKERFLSIEIDSFVNPIRPLISFSSIRKSEEFVEHLKKVNFYIILTC